MRANTKDSTTVDRSSQLLFHFHRLGKTVQTIAVLLALKEAERLDESPALIVCPTSLLSNWKRELAKFAPSLSLKICSGPDRARVFKAAIGSKRKRYSGPDVLLMSYGSVRQDVVMLSKAQYAIMIIDESQSTLAKMLHFLGHGIFSLCNPWNTFLTDKCLPLYFFTEKDIKNHKAAVTKAVKKIGSQADFRLALTGTVVENRLAELHSCFDFALPNYLGTLKDFTARFAKPIENERDEEMIELLKRMTSCFMLRREKTDPSVISDLPDKIETKRYVKICPEQVALYESIRESVFDTMAANAEAPTGSGSKRNALVLKLLSDLKQVCNHVCSLLGTVAVAQGSSFMESAPKLLFVVLTFVLVSLSTWLGSRPRTEIDLMIWEPSGLRSASICSRCSRP